MDQQSFGVMDDGSYPTALFGGMEVPKQKLDSDNASHEVMPPIWWRQLVAFCLLVGLNFLPFLFTYGDYGTDGFEYIGLPFTIYEFGGNGGVRSFYPAHLASNAVVAFFGALMLAEAIPARYWPAQFKLKTVLVATAIIAGLVTICLRGRP